MVPASRICCCASMKSIHISERDGEDELDLEDGCSEDA
jgi:hypothetical protein